MTRMLSCYFILLVLSLTACSDLSNNKIETVLKDAKAYPLTVEYKMFRNSDTDVKDVIEKKLVEQGFVTAQLKHTKDDVGKPLIYFTTKAEPYLIATNDTLKSFDEQRIKVAEEVFVQVRTIEINPAGNKAVVDYVTTIVNPTPFIILYKQDLSGEQKRRTFFTKKNDQWTWDGEIIQMLK